MGSGAKGRRCRAFSTGQVARFCFVSPETILNWIHGGEIKAQRTAGGQFRILAEDLRSFMAVRGMSTVLLDEDGSRPYCWAYHCEPSPDALAPNENACANCLVHRSGTLNCWELHGILPWTGRRFDKCAECDYYNLWKPPCNTHK